MSTPLIKRYRVVRDRQGGAFGMDRDYTIDEWIQQARDWCFADDNDDLDNEFERLQKNHKDYNDWDILNIISDIWDIEFAEVKTIKVFGKSETTPVKVKVLTKY